VPDKSRVSALTTINAHGTCIALAKGSLHP
jgi:hypothetical protein